MTIIEIAVEIGTTADELAEIIADRGDGLFEDEMEFSYADGNDSYSDSGWEQGTSEAVATLDYDMTYGPCVEEYISEHVDLTKEGVYEGTWYPEYYCEDIDLDDSTMDEGVYVIVTVVAKGALDED